MSLKPKILTAEEVTTQTMALQVKRTELTLARDAALTRLNQIEQITKENELLESKTRELVSESVSLMLEEWEKSKELYPEVRLGILQKALDFINPEDKKKK